MDWNVLGGKLQSMGAGFQGRLPEYYAQQNQAQMLELKRDEQRRKLTKERLVAMYQDARTADQFLEMGENERALELIDNRIGFINQYNGDPTDTQEIRDLVASGDIEAARRELKLFTMEAENNELLKPLLTEAEKLARKKFEQDYGPDGFKAEEARLKELKSDLEEREFKMAQDRFEWEREQGRQGTVPPGYRLSEDGNTLERLGGGPVEDEANAAQEALQLAQADYNRKFTIVDSAIDQAIKIIETDGRWAAGVGSVLSGLPESSARTLAAKLDTVKANLGFEELQTMRANSPTGGALGNVSEKEIAFLQAIQGNLDQGLDPGELYKVLKSIKDTRTGFKNERAEIMGITTKPADDGSVSVGGYTIKEVKRK